MPTWRPLKCRFLTSYSIVRWWIDTKLILWKIHILIAVQDVGFDDPCFSRGRFTFTGWSKIPAILLIVKGDILLFACFSSLLTFCKVVCIIKIENHNYIYICTFNTSIHSQREHYFWFLALDNIALRDADRSWLNYLSSRLDPLL